jgi:hypothetical protein
MGGITTTHTATAKRALRPVLSKKKEEEEKAELVDVAGEREISRLGYPAAAEQRENISGLPYRLWRFAGLLHCRNIWPLFSLSREFRYRNGVELETGQ